MDGIERDNIHYKARREGFTEDNVDEGTPAVISIGCICYPATVISVRRKCGKLRRVAVRRDRCYRGLFIPDQNGELLIFSRRKDGSLIQIGYGVHNGYRVSLGYREKDVPREI